jgi:hypothetical protein
MSQASQLGVFKELTSREARSEFLERYFICAKRPPERQVFLRGMADDLFGRSHLAGYFVNGAMVGGHCIVLEPPFSEIQLLPEDVRRTHPLLQATGERDIVSLPILWLNAEYRGPVHSTHSAHLWRDMFRFIVSTERKYLIYAYLQSEPRNWQLYKRAGKPINLYSGRLANGGVGGVDRVSIDALPPHIDFLTAFLGRHATAAKRIAGSTQHPDAVALTA